MRKANIYREYRLKVYLNMNHFITIHGKQGQTHPHTWEFVVTMVVAREGFVEFRAFEALIEEYLEKYQNKIINTIAPFDMVIPTIENVTDYFDAELQELLRQQGGELVSIEGSETPTRGYIVSHRNEPEFAEWVGHRQAEQVSGVIQYVVGKIVGEEAW